MYSGRSHDFENDFTITLNEQIKKPGGGVLPYMGHIAMYRCEGYGFQAVYYSIGYKKRLGLE